MTIMDSSQNFHMSILDLIKGMIIAYFIFIGCEIRAIDFDVYVNEILSLKTPTHCTPELAAQHHNNLVQVQVAAVLGPCL